MPSIEPMLTCSTSPSVKDTTPRSRFSGAPVVPTVIDFAKISGRYGDYYATVGLSLYGLRKILKQAGLTD